MAKVEIFGAQDEKLFIEISQKRLAQLGLDLNQVLAQLGAQNAVEGAGVLECRRRRTRAGARRPGQFNSVEATAPLSDPRQQPGDRRGEQLRLSDIAEIRRGTIDPPR